LARAANGDLKRVNPGSIERIHIVSKSAAVLLVCALTLVAALSSARVSSASPGVGSGPFVVGVTEDAALGMDDGGLAMYSQMKGYGLKVIRMSVFWDGSANFTDKAALARAIPPAVASGHRVLLAIAPAEGHNTAFSDANGPANLASFVVQLAQTFPQVQDFIVGNEPNLGRFNTPSFDGTTPIGAYNYERALAAAYDALHGFNANLDVIGIATSPRGDDNPTGRPSISPVRFIAGVASAYKSSARSAPIADNVAFHPYPNPNKTDDPPAKGYQWPNAGLPNLDRLEQAWYDGFNNTGQPLFAEDATAAKAGGFVKWVLDETAYQVQTTLPGYTGTEPNQLVSEDTQAQYYAQLVKMYACDSSRVASLLFFHWTDETDRARYQSGFARIDGSIRPAAQAVKDAIATPCASTTKWKHSTGVSGASASFVGSGAFRFTATAQEDVKYTAGIYKSSKSGKSAKALGKPVATAVGTLKAYYSAGVKFPGKLKSGTYVYAIKLTAVLNPARSVTFVSKPFTRK
jgi:uncharacterized protein YchJ